LPYILIKQKFAGKYSQKIGKNIFLQKISFFDNFVGSVWQVMLIGYRYEVCSAFYVLSFL